MSGSDKPKRLTPWRLSELHGRARRLQSVLAKCANYGSPQEAKVLADELGVVSMPVVAAVLGNHDHESGVPDEVRHILQAAGVQVLDGEAIELLGVGIAGAKGFAGGFGLAVVARHATPKRRQRQVCHDLRKYELALMHRHPERGSPAMGSKSAARRSNLDQPRRTNCLGRSSTFQRLG